MRRSNQNIKRRKVTFSFESIDANEVILMEDFNNYMEVQLNGKESLQAL